MSSWTALGLPGPEVNNFGYTIAAGLLRTKFDTAHPRQVRLNTRNIKTFTLTFLLNTEQVKIAETFIEQGGYSWFGMPLNPSGGPEITIRVTGDYKVSSRGLGLHALDLTVETS